MPPSLPSNLPSSLWSRIGSVVFILASGGAIRAASAQATAPTTTAAPVAASAPAVLTTSGFEAFNPGLDAIDTGWARHGYRDFTHYTTPNACVAAVEAAQMVADRARVDTADIDPIHDTLPSAVVSVARQCGAHFSAATQPVVELRALFELELARNNDHAALAVAERYLSAQSKEEYPWALAMVARDLLWARPMRLVAAEAIIARLDSLGPSANEPRYAIHDQLNEISVQRSDAARIEREGGVLYQVRQQLTPAQRTDEKVNGVFTNLLKAQVDGRRSLGGGIDERLWIILRQWLDLELPRSSSLADALTRVKQAATAAGMDSTVLQASLHLLTTHPMLGFSNLGKPVAPLPATFWFSASGDTIWPRKNHVTILMWRDGENIDAKRNALIRHLHQRFGDALDIVLYSQTFGYFRDSPPLSPAEEAQKLRWYFFDYLKLPISALAVLETSFTTLPDGRRRARPSAYLGHPPIENFKLVGKDGTMRGALGASTREAMDAYVAHALEEH
jgi:hypothetical protein